MIHLSFLKTCATFLTLCLLILLLFSCAKRSRVFYQKFHVFFVSEGSGGDFSGKNLILDNIKDNKKFNKLNVFSFDSLQDFQEKKSLSRSSHKNILFLIGQTVVNNFIKNCNQEAGLDNIDNIHIYSHILDKNIIEFLNKKSNKCLLDKNVKLYTTYSQKKFINRTDIDVIPSARIIRTLNFTNKSIKNDYRKNKKLINLILKKDTFLIGGDFKDENFQNVEISLNEYLNAILNNTKQKEISFILHPRFFTNCKNTEEKNLKIKNLINLASDHRLRINFYVSKKHLDSISPNIRNNVFYYKFDFNTLLYAIEFKENIRKKVFATIDQCNISADNIYNKIKNIFLRKNLFHLMLIKDAKKSNFSVDDAILKQLLIINQF